MKRFEPRKRTTIDGRVWWCVFDLESMKYVPAYRFSKKKDAKYFIEHKTAFCWI